MKVKHDKQTRNSALVHVNKLVIAYLLLFCYYFLRKIESLEEKLRQLEKSFSREISGNVEVSNTIIPKHQERV